MQQLLPSDQEALNFILFFCLSKLHFSLWNKLQHTTGFLQWNIITDRKKGTNNKSMIDPVMVKIANNPNQKSHSAYLSEDQHWHNYYNILLPDYKWTKKVSFKKTPQS